MRRVCKPGGVVARARRRLHRVHVVSRATPALDAWLEIYSTVARANDGEPDAGRFLLAWAHAAGFSDVAVEPRPPGASPRRTTATWWGELWADRMTKSAIGDQAVELGIRDRAPSSTAMADAWRRWAAHPDGWFAVLHGEILARA